MYEYIKAYAIEKNLSQTLKALPFARESHDGQLRKGQEGKREPYINHPLEMAAHAIALGLGEDALLSAILLHDVCEDCGVEPEELPVDREVQEIVRLVTRLDGESKAAYYGEIGENKLATIVKLIDRCHNVSKMSSAFSREKLWRYMEETKDYVLPLLMEVKERWPEYCNQCFLVEYHICSQLDTINALLEREDL